MQSVSQHPLTLDVLRRAAEHQAHADRERAALADLARERDAVQAQIEAGGDVPALLSQLDDIVVRHHQAEQRVAALERSVEQLRGDGLQQARAEAAADICSQVRPERDDAAQQLLACLQQAAAANDRLDGLHTALTVALEGEPSTLSVVTPDRTCTGRLSEAARLLAEQLQVQ